MSGSDTDMAAIRVYDALSKMTYPHKCAIPSGVIA